MRKHDYITKCRDLAGVALVPVCAGRVVRRFPKLRISRFFTVSAAESRVAALAILGARPLAQLVDVARLLVQFRLYRLEPHGILRQDHKKTILSLATNWSRCEIFDPNKAY